MPDRARPCRAPDAGRSQSGVVAEEAQPEDSRQESARRQSARSRLRLRQGVRGARSRCAQGRYRDDADDLAAVVAGGFRPLWPVHDPYGVARRRDLPGRRRTRRRGRRAAALRPAQQLARQRQPRQGAPPAVAGQGEIRPVDLVGRPVRTDRQRRARIDGAEDLRLLGRPRRCVGTRRGRLLGAGERMARRRALHRRPRARFAAGGGSDGADLRQSRRPKRQS